MKSIVSIFMVLALVVATSFPGMSHAMVPHDAAKIEKAEASKNSDCHKHEHAKQAQSTMPHDKDHSACCEKGVCKCSSGNCYGMSKIFGNGSNTPSAFSSLSLGFAFGSQFVDSALPDRLKRPPKA